MRRRAARLLVLALGVGHAARAADVQPPELLERVELVAPPGAPPPLRDHVFLEFTVGVEGRASDVVVLESAGAGWDQSAQEAVRRWRFKPAFHEGHEVPIRVQVALPLPLPRLTLSLESRDAGPEDESPPDAGLAAVALPEPDGGHAEFSTVVTGKAVERPRGAGDLAIEVGALRAVPRGTGAEFLKLAPGILLTNEGGEGHPERIFLRGFDAREGQDLEVSVDGVPVNDSGNLHGNGYADLNFLMPEVVQGLRVVEGPFDPRQGNFAVAGSAEYELGVARRGVSLRGTYGTFNTFRLAATYGPQGQPSHTFGAASVQRSDGFGRNRASDSARAVGQMELQLSPEVSLRLSAVGYTATFRQAGVLRADDVAAGRVGFFDTYDDRQGGSALRGHVSAALHAHHGPFTHDHQVFGMYRGSRIRENFTGFLLDPQEPQQLPHGQRGDLIDRDNTQFTLGLKGLGKLKGRLFERNQELEVGYFARLDFIQGQQQRLLTQTNVPYAKEVDLTSRVSDLGLYVDGSFSPWWFLTVKGGVRAEVLGYDVQDNCAVREVRRPSALRPPYDDSCLSQRTFGQYREPTERYTAAGLVLMPRVSATLGPWEGVSVTGAFGDGVRSIDPVFIKENRDTPFASIRAWEAGLLFSRPLGPVDVSARAVGFGTRVDRDLIFSQQEGRNLIGGSTTRLGGSVLARAKGSFFDVSGHGTFVSSRFDDTGLLVPYVPDLVLRLDAAVFHTLPWEVAGGRFTGTLGLGLTYVGPRALPFGERSDTIFVADVNAEVSWRFLTVGVAATNLLDARYRLAEFNYASDFQRTGPLPTLVPVRHFTAGAPRQVLFTLAVHVGGAS